MTEDKCAFMDCELEDDEVSLGELLECLPKDSQGYGQVEILIKHHNFKKEDRLCASCFWK